MKYRWHLIVVGLVLTAACRSLPSDKAKAIATAEQFVKDNGYTDASENVLKSRLDHESLEFGQNRAEMVKIRFNTLRPKAIGIRKGKKGATPGWSVAFEYTKSDSPDTCRVVTMNPDGTDIQMQHVDGLLPYFKGFEDK